MYVKKKKKKKKTHEYGISSEISSFITKIAAQGDTKSSGRVIEKLFCLEMYYL